MHTFSLAEIGACIFIRDDEKFTVLVDSGILPVCRDEHGMAMVLSHEIAHVLAGHKEEKEGKAVLYRWALKLFLPSQLFQLSKDAPDTRDQNPPLNSPTISHFVALYSLLLLTIWRRFSRQLEFEADHIGLLIMHNAGYDIREAAGFHERLAEVAEAKVQEALQKEPNAIRLPDFMSTHPEVRRNG